MSSISYDVYLCENQKTDYAKNQETTKWFYFPLCLDPLPSTLLLLALLEQCNGIPQIASTKSFHS